MIETLTLRRLALDADLKPFDCDCEDLNEFFLDEAIPHLKQLLAVTYVFENETETVAFFSVLNDRITREDTSLSRFKRLQKIFPKEKQNKYPSVPSVKIGRFGVHKDYQRMGIGTEILDYMKAMFTTANRTGCRCITVDAYKNSTGFYQTNGFDYLTMDPKAEKDDTRLMFYDLYMFRPPIT